ncbi:ABC transporter permease subunit [Roseiconus nitratireducens]|uniref:ABC transporter permease subunit n=1 Tax=Roseiconus nitratireducens TaxID=2605748 RepID=A0A5M6DL81_9BACT|nr:ABC transporter permease [Roseiconus nitratireducens]KAA5546105.1 ABC transporter permease subunit [Roseiconus nitratireducens]
MIFTIIQISLRRLLHNRIELLLTFVVPIAFFSVFAVIFGNGIGSGTTPKIKVVVVDEAETSESESLAASLRDSAGLRFMDSGADSGGESGEESSAALHGTLSREQASDLVRHGNVTIGIVLRPAEDGVGADLLADASDQVAGQVVAALVGRELAIARTKSLAAARVASHRTPAGIGSQAPAQTSSLRKPPGTGAVPNSPPADSASFVKLSQGTAMARGADVPQDGSEILSPAIQIVDVIGEGKTNPVVSMYAAGIAVMFLLFGATGGGGALLEERENTTLDRLLSTRLTMDQLLLGKWFYLTGLGFFQVCVMFLWGQFVFGVDLLGHLDGFVMMTLVTSSAAAAFGLLLATLCKTRGQLNGLSVILVLTMSALGGSMVPRYVMSERMQELGLWTFNAWALDGYNKVFWRDMPVETLWPQLAVLMAAGVTFLLVARALAVRWEFD